MKPVGQYILVKPDASEEMSSGGIIVPENCRSVSNRGVVVAVGEGSVKEPMRVHVGQVVFRVKDAGEEVLIEGETYYLVKQEWLLATLN